MSPKSVLGAVLALSIPASTLSAQVSAFATKVVAYDDKNQAGGGVFNPQNALGAPGGASLVHSLGEGGYLTLGFSVTITDGPGADLIVFENPFAFSGQVFAEVMFVEVSSNGKDFVRFPSRYQGPATSGGQYATAYPGVYDGLAGVMPHYAGQAGVDLFDVVSAGGDAFDLADLSQHILVLTGKVDLKAITQVRLVDAVAGTAKDSQGRIIQDPTVGSADVNAVGVIHHTGNVKGTGPSLELQIVPQGRLSLRISDPDGLSDLDPASLRVRIDDVEISPWLLLNGMQIKSGNSQSILLELPGNLPPGWFFRLSVSIKDKSGQRSGGTRVS